MDKKKIGLIAGIVIFIILLIAITVIYNKGIGNQEKLVDEAVDIGVLRINDSNFSSEMLNTDKIVVLDFYENMCPPCTSMVPTIIKIAKLGDKVKVGMINISDSDTKNLAQRYDVSATPTIVILKDEKIVKTFIGATSEETIMEVINNLMEKENEE